MDIKPITWKEALPIRHNVLWPNEPVSYCKVAGDEDALHFGVFDRDEIICVASLYITASSVRLRKFATLLERQGQGVGSRMIEYIISTLASLDFECLWFDARESAVEFYKRFGFNAYGERFYKNDVPYFKMNMPL